MRAFVTGAGGFVGSWLLAHLAEMGDECTRLDPGIDLGSGTDLEEAVGESRPEVIYHLAALTHVGESWHQPKETYRVNVIGTLEILEVARQLDPMPRVVLISSSEVYGKGNGAPLGENAELRPLSPYASSKVAAEFLALQEHLGRGLDVVRARPFNHIGRGQSDAFVVSAFAKRVLEAQRDGSGEILVGNLSAVRDFSDVRDVVRAYRLLADKGVSGEVYNVCSGQGHSIEEILEVLLDLAGGAIKTRVDDSLVRPVDIAYLVGDSSRLRSLTDWQPRFGLAETLSEVLDDWRERLSTD